jgi:hypothetical protein
MEKTAALLERRFEIYGDWRKKGSFECLETGAVFEDLHLL